MRHLLAFGLLLVVLQAGKPAESQKEPMSMKITPIIFVPAIEPSLPFWVGRLGFTKTVELPDGTKLGFVILVKGGAELMIETQSSVERDNAAMIDYARPTAGLYIEVDDFDDLLKRVDGVEIVMQPRTTFYGMKEIGVKEPGGNIVTFAARVQK